MAHLIEKPIDRVFSTEGIEWHGLAEHRETIGEAEKDIISFAIAEWAGDIVHNGKTVNLKEFGWKMLLGDFSHREDLEAKDHLRPLFIPRDSYTVIDNAAVIKLVEDSLEGVDHEITTIGTLAGGRRMFVCVRLNASKKIELANGETILPFLCFVTSHDGTLALEVYDTMVRIVCNNTLEWSRDAAGQVGFKVFHTKGANARLLGMAELLAEILAGREKFIQEMDKLSNIKITKDQAVDITLGYFYLSLKDPKDPDGELRLSTRTRNATEEIVRLAWKGKGNTGNNLWMLLNGATEYWGDGEGTGKGGKRDKGRKVYSAHFGRGMEHKRNFAAYLMDDMKRAQGVKEQAKFIVE